MGHKTLTLISKHFKLRCTLVEEMTDSATNGSWNTTGSGYALVTTLLPRSIKTFGDLATSFASQFAANKTKLLEVVDLFDIKQRKGKTLKNYLACFNNASIRVNDPDHKFFVKAFQKGLRAGQFSNSLALRKPLIMEEIRAYAEKHIEVEEDQTDRLEVEKQSRKGDTQPTQKGENRYPNNPKDYPLMLTPPTTQILHEIYHTNLLKYPRDVKGRQLGPNKQECIWPLHRRFSESARGDPEANIGGTLGPKEAKHPRKTAEDRRGRSRSPQRRNTRHRGVITTISGGGGGVPEERSWKRKASDVFVVRGKANMTLTSIITFGERVLIDQWSSANILYWSTYIKMGLKLIDMEPCAGKLYGFVSDQVEVKGAVELETTFGECNHA
ncbi:hypothetical protein CR513_44334, partial [Mucuna pruriens]